MFQVEGNFQTFGFGLELSRLLCDAENVMGALSSPYTFSLCTYALIGVVPFPLGMTSRSAVG